MFLEVMALLFAVHVQIDLPPRVQPPTPTCGIKTVGYRFSGTPGQKFRYAGDWFTIPKRGWIELIADRRHTTYRVYDRELPLEVWPQNAFGFREVPLPSSSAPAASQPAGAPAGSPSGSA